MTVYTPEELLARWNQEKLTSEQAIGQLLQHIKTLQARLVQVEGEMAVMIRQGVREGSEAAHNANQPRLARRKPRRKPAPAS